MKISEQQKCSRCNTDVFEPSEISDSPVIDFLKKTRYKFICNSCASKLSEWLRAGDDLSSLIEGKHFYWEGPFMVFTEYYHLKRGKCCGNRCRHCAYGIHIS